MASEEIEILSAVLLLSGIDLSKELHNLKAAIDMHNSSNYGDGFSNESFQKAIESIFKTKAMVVRTLNQMHFTDTGKALIIVNEIKLELVFEIIDGYSINILEAKRMS